MSSGSTSVISRSSYLFWVNDILSLMIEAWHLLNLWCGILRNFKHARLFGCAGSDPVESHWANGFQTWWRHQMETFSTLLAICSGNSPVPNEFPAQRPVTRSFDLRLNKRLSKQSWGWWFETLSRPLWRHRNEWKLRPQWLKGLRQRHATVVI